MLIIWIVLLYLIHLAEMYSISELHAKMKNNFNRGPNNRLYSGEYSHRGHPERHVLWQ